MVLDYLLSPARARREPHDMLLIAMLFVSFGVLVHVFLPSLKGSSIIFAVIPAIPLVWGLLLKEEKREETEIEEAYKLWYTIFPKSEGEAPKYNFFTYHNLLIKVFSYFFLGAIVAYSFWYAVLPPETTKDVFGEQISELKNIQSSLAPQVLLSGSFALKGERFTTLFTHNMQVLALMFAFCLVYGIGSIYILLWNASLIGVVIGQKVQASGVAGGVLGFLGLLPHGIFEIFAYFIASIAGGVLSMAVMRWKYNKRELPLILLDVFALTLAAVVLLAVGAFIESVY